MSAGPGRLAPLSALGANVPSRAAPPPPDLLRRALSGLVRERHPGARLVAFRREPRPCRSSWAIEDLVLQLSDGSEVRVVWKDGTREAPGSNTLRVKPAEVLHPEREVWMYANVLRTLGEGAEAWGWVCDAPAGISWLFLEPVPGTPLCEVGERDIWLAAAAWLGRFHARAGRVPDPAPVLLRHDQALHAWWYQRALAAAARRATGGAGARAAGLPARNALAVVHGLSLHHQRAIAAVLRPPHATLHGEFYPDNILVTGRGRAVRVLPVDWEMAAVGPPVLDLAALVAGRWSESDRMSLAGAYRTGCVEAGGACPALSRLLPLLDAAQLLLAVQWLGWAEDWRPPSEHDTDWLREAVAACRRMDRWVG